MAISGRHVAVVGAGPGGLTAAMILARRGFRVSVFEATERVGGRNAALRVGPYTFDTGPTFLVLPQVLEEVFAEAGADLHAVLDVRPVDPLYRLQFADKTLEPVTDPGAMKAAVEAVFPGHGPRLGPFLDRERRRFERLYPAMQTPFHQWRAFLRPQMLAAAPHVSPRQSLFSLMKDYFGDDDLAMSFTFQSKYLGMPPWACPALFAMLSYSEHAFGIHHVMGGLHRISSAMADVARGHGAEVHLGRSVKRVLTRGRAACGVELEDGEQIAADEVVLNADFGHAAEHLFAPGTLRKYTPAKLARKKLSCSTFMVYLGLDRRYDLPHHTLCFAERYQDHIQSVFENGPLEKNDFSFYVRNAEATDTSQAPEGHSAMYVLVTTPNMRAGIDWKAERAAYLDLVLEKLGARLGMTDLRGHIRAEYVLTPEDWEEKYRVYRGATFNLAHNWSQLMVFRPHNKFEELDHCYLVGGGTHPGSGLPTIYESGRIAANLIARRHGVEFQTHNPYA